MNAPTQPASLQLAHASKPVTPRDRLLRMSEVERLTAAKKSTLYVWIKEKTFPRPVKIGRMSAWSESAVLQWVQDRIKEAQQ